ncbi:hypothetical protein L2E82_10930 [Cichorium intybus]|uniref:Uncharacterized protein n=1 Tax=Cichorium intybus TaxID=13427 RepID=A0ACB9GCJ2_CICIN|nr:hypothetical protein L2E82_10930 [Cichorium intybus]
MPRFYTALDYIRWNMTSFLVLFLVLMTDDNKVRISYSAMDVICTNIRNGSPILRFRRLAYGKGFHKLGLGFCNVLNDSEWVTYEDPIILA